MRNDDMSTVSLYGHGVLVCKSQKHGSHSATCIRKCYIDFEVFCKVPCK